MNVDSGSLRHELIDMLRRQGPNAPKYGVRERPAFFFAPRSTYAHLFAKPMVELGVRLVAAVETIAAPLLPTLESLPSALEGEGWTLDRFAKDAGSYRDALGVDFSESPTDSSLFEEICSRNGIHRVDFVAVLAELEMTCVYQTPGVMRTLTLERASEFLGLETLLSDRLSRETLYAFLLFRITYDRSWLQRILVGVDEEYFSTRPSRLTFALGEDEEFCDAGAYIGTVITRFAGATRGRYRAIHAFEPDRKNFRRLEGLKDLGLHDFHPHNCALADRNEVINFHEVGNMGSHLTLGGHGSSSIEAVRLDDQIGDLSFLKMDIEGGEALALNGAKRLLSTCAPRLAVTVYHYANDLLEVVAAIRRINPAYRFWLRQHAYFYYDTLIYAATGANGPGEA